MSPEKVAVAPSAEMGQRKRFERFLTLWLGQLISVVGSGLTAFALGVYVFEMTGTATSYALTLLFAFLPAFFLGPLCGVLADRHDRRLLMQLSDLGAAGSMAYVLLCLLFGPVALWQIYSGIALCSVFSALRSPAYKASVSDMLPPAKYEQASGLIQLASSAQFLLSPLLAGVLLSFCKIEQILLLDMLSFALAMLATSLVRPFARHAPKAPAVRHFGREINEAWQLLLANKAVLLLIGLTAAVLFLVGLLQALLGPMLLSLSDARSFGAALSVCACGLLVGSVLIGVLGIKQNLVTILAVSLGLLGVFYAALGVSTQIVWIVLPGVLLFLMLPFINTSIEVLIRRTLDQNKQGRAWALISTLTFTGSILAFSSAGFLADRVFNPLFLVDGALADSALAALIGTGPGRGIACLFLLSGLAVVGLAVMIFRSRRLRSLEEG